MGVADVVSALDHRPRLTAGVRQYARRELGGAERRFILRRQFARACALREGGFDRALDNFFADCVAQRCAFAGHGDIGKTYDALM
ncbi:MAG: hypothetical protein ABR508_10115, partial [Candidatus Baltobacteraceae bacterium]